MTEGHQWEAGQSIVAQKGPANTRSRAPPHLALLSEVGCVAISGCEKEVGYVQTLTGRRLFICTSSQQRLGLGLEESDRCTFYFALIQREPSLGPKAAQRRLGLGTRTQERACWPSRG